MSQVAASGFRVVLREAFDTMPKRTQRIAGLGFVVVALTWVLGVWYFMVGGIQSMESELMTLQKSHNTLQMMQMKYDLATVQIEEAERRLGKHKGVAPSAFLEQAAVASNVQDQLTGINERDQETVGSLKQTRYTVNLKMAPIQNTMDFLYAIEESGFMAIETLDVRSKFFSGEKRLTSKIDLISYASLEAKP